MKVGFVVLGYGNYPMYAECVDWLMKIKNIEMAEIILVDNCSPDGTGEKLKVKYACIHNITVLENTENQGFAKGNNLGYRYAREQLKCDAIVVMNSDVFIKDQDFYNVLVSVIGNNKDVSIIAPDVLGDGNRHTNPYRTTPVTVKDAKKRIAIKKLIIILLKIGINYESSKKAVANNADEIQVRIDNVVPHGSCIIFCNAWVKNEDLAFFPGTFLYHEEFFLDEYFRQKKYLSSYIPELVVKHIGDASLNDTIKIENKKKLFVLKNQIHSLKLYIQFIKDPKNNWSQENLDL